MNEINWAVLVGGGVVGFSAWYACNSVAAMRRAAACLIRRAAAVEAAEAARKRAGDAAYVLACMYLEIEVTPCTTPTSAVPPGAATDEI